MRSKRTYTIFSTVTILLLSTQINAQMIKGRVLDIETDSAVAFANVYFNSSMQGTITGVDGSFELEVAGFEGQDIVISSVGYESLTLTDYSPELTYKVLLVPAVNMLREIIVEPDDMPRARKEKIFLREFLGTSNNAVKCEIENLKELKLVFLKSQSTLLGFADVPLIIRNDALGYRIIYYLDEFSWKTNGSMGYKGNFRFEEDSTLNSRQQKKIEKAREKAYKGSRMHFIRTLWSETTDDNIFRVFQPEDQKRLTYSDICCEETENGQKMLAFDGALRVEYNQSPSLVEVKKDKKVIISENGFFDPTNILWEGFLASDRIGDMLPFEY